MKKVQEYKKEGKESGGKRTEIPLNIYNIFINLNAWPKMKLSDINTHSYSIANNRKNESLNLYTESTWILTNTPWYVSYSGLLPLGFSGISKGSSVLPFGVNIAVI